MTRRSRPFTQIGWWVVALALFAGCASDQAKVTTQRPSSSTKADPPAALGDGFCAGPRAGLLGWSVSEPERTPSMTREEAIAVVEGITSKATPDPGQKKRLDAYAATMTTETFPFLKDQLVWVVEMRGISVPLSGPLKTDSDGKPTGTTPTPARTVLYAIDDASHQELFEHYCP